MNSISYLDSMLSRSFAPDRSPSSAKRSRSHSSLPGSRRPSSSSSSPSSPSSTSPPPSSLSTSESSPNSFRCPRRHRHDIDTNLLDATDSSTSYPYRHTLRRTGSTPAHVYSKFEYSSDDDDSNLDDQLTNPPQPRWGALWGLTGWLDEAINPNSRTCSRKNSTEKANQSSSSTFSTTKKVRRMPSLDDLFINSSAPPRATTRRTASSGSGSRRSAPSHQRNFNPTDTESDRDSIRTRQGSRKQAKFGHAASLMMTNDPQDQHEMPQPVDQIQETLDNHIPSIDPAREDVVDFIGGDFASDNVLLASTQQPELSISSHQHPLQPSHNNPSARSNSNNACVSSESLNVQDDGESVEQPKQEPVSSEADQTSTSLHSQAIKANQTITIPNSSLLVAPITAHAAGDDTAPLPKRSPDAPPPYSEKDTFSSVSMSSTGSHTSSKQKKSSSTCRRRDLDSPLKKQVQSPNHSSMLPQESSSSDQIDSNPPKRPRREGSGSESAASVSNSASSSSQVSQPTPTSETIPREWLASRSNGPTPPRRRRFSTTRAIRKVLSALRNIIIAILFCPVRYAYLIRNRYKSKEADAVREAVNAAYETQMPVLLSEKDTILDDHHTTKQALEKIQKTPSIRFGLQEHPRKADRSSVSRPKTPMPQLESDNSENSAEEKDIESLLEPEPITEEQAIARAKRLDEIENTRAGETLGSTPTTLVVKSRLLPNPHPVDPLLAHDKNAEPVDEDMARQEAQIQAERKAISAERRAARKNGGTVSPIDRAASGMVVLAQPSVAQIPRGPLSSIIHHSPKTLVLDLDETLIHSTSRSPTYYPGSGKKIPTGSGILGLESLGAVLGLRANENPGRIRPHMVEVVLDGRSVIYHVYKRPWVDYFLRKVASWYHVIIFTASVQEYADPVIDWLDQGRGLISGRLFREACTFQNGSYVKNLQVIDGDLSTVCLVDNSPASYAINQANGIPIEGWTHDPNDEALLDLLPVLDSLRFATDVRHILGIRGFPT